MPRVAAVIVDRVDGDLSEIVRAKSRIDRAARDGYTLAKCKCRCRNVCARSTLVTPVGYPTGCRLRTFIENKPLHGRATEIGFQSVHQSKFKLTRSWWCKTGLCLPFGWLPAVVGLAGYEWCQNDCNLNLLASIRQKSICKLI